MHSDTLSEFGTGDGQVGIHDVVADHDGMAWITQARTTFETNRSIVKLDPKTGVQTNIQVRAGGPNLIYFEQIAQPAANGDIWMHDGPNMVRLTPRTETFTSFRIPQVMGGMNNSTDVDSKGRAIANARSGVVRFDPSKAGDKVPYPGWQLFQQALERGQRRVEPARLGLAVRRVERITEYRLTLKSGLLGKPTLTEDQLAQVALDLGNWPWR